MLIYVIVLCYFKHAIRDHTHVNPKSKYNVTLDVKWPIHILSFAAFVIFANNAYCILNNMYKKFFI